MFVRPVDGRVVEVIREREDIDKEWHPDFLAMCVEVTGQVPQPDVGWLLDGRGRLRPPEGT